MLERNNSKISLTELQQGGVKIQNVCHNREIIIQQSFKKLAPDFLVTPILSYEYKKTYVRYKDNDAPKCCDDTAKFYRGIHKIGTRCFCSVHPNAEVACSRQFWILGHACPKTTVECTQ